jgi:diadenosine tetraphosphatase ApaH/serine/threonine PP2A family protein phosphatase
VDFAEVRERLAAALTAAHANFLHGLKTSLGHGRYFFCHAGVRPGVPLPRQSDDDLLWIHDEFVLSPMDFGKIVVHGHTPVAVPEIHPNRINLDTGAFATGRLTLMALEEDGPRLCKV